MIKDKSTLKNLIMVLKNDYKTPGKLLIGGIVAGQCFAILLILFVFLHNFVYFPSMLESKFYSALQKEDVNLPETTANTSVMIKDIAKFLEVSADSINQRQKILENLMRTMGTYMGFILSKEDLEQQLSSLSLYFSNCNAARGRYLKLFSETINPFEAPEVAEEFKKLVEHDSLFRRHVIDPQEENQRWKDLCDLCQKEVNTVNNRLIKILSLQ